MDFDIKPAFIAFDDRFGGGGGAAAADGGGFYPSSFFPIPVYYCRFKALISLLSVWGVWPDDVFFSLLG